MLCSLSHLKNQDVKEIENLESELGITVLAFSCHDAKPSALEQGSLEKIQSLEKRLGLSLVAVEA